MKRSPIERLRHRNARAPFAGGTVELNIFGEHGHGTQEFETHADENTTAVQFFDRASRAGTR